MPATVGRLNEAKFVQVETISSYYAQQRVDISHRELECVTETKFKNKFSTQL